MSEGDSKTSGKIEIKSSEEFYKTLERLREESCLVSAIDHGKKGTLCILYWFKPTQVLKQAGLL